MLELVFLASLSSVFGVLIRAALEKESARLCLYHSITIGVIAGIYAFFNPIVPLPLTLGKYVGVFVFFFIAGYVVSDMIESLTFIVIRRKHPLTKRKVKRKR